MGEEHEDCALAAEVDTSQRPRLLKSYARENFSIYYCYLYKALFD